MVRTVAPFPDPPVPDIDSAGLRVPPWVKYPNIPLGSLGWRMGTGEEYWYSFRDWWCAQPGATRLAVKTAYPEPAGWSGFYARLKQNG
jgi:hypothetical protein